MKSFQQGLPPDTWDADQHPLGGHLLQGRAWAQFQLALGRTVVWQRGDGWSWLGEVRRGRGVSYLYAPYGPTARSAKTFEVALASLRRAAIDLGLVFVRCEPMGIPTAAVAKSELQPVAAMQPAETLVLDLTLTEAELRSGLNSGHRNAINGADRRGLSFEFTRASTAIAPFLNLIAETSSSRGFRAHPKAYYRTMLETLLPLEVATLGLAQHEGSVEAAAIFLDYDGTRAYAHAGASAAARKLQAAAPLVWQSALDAKRLGATRLDLWGVAPADAPQNHPWAGFTQFKRGFGGQDSSFNGTWELPVRPQTYRLIRLAKWLRASPSARDGGGGDR